MKTNGQSYGLTPLMTPLIPFDFDRSMTPLMMTPFDGWTKLWVTPLMTPLTLTL
jgi:hypothetical protein